VEVELRFFLILVSDGGEYSVVSLLLHMREIRLAVATEQEGGWAPHPICNFGKTEKSHSALGNRTRFLCPQSQRVLRRLATGILSEKCVVRRFRLCANVIDFTYTNLDSIAYYTLRLYGIACCS
jgi:hypothetical protein